MSTKENLRALRDELNKILFAAESIYEGESTERAKELAALIKGSVLKSASILDRSVGGPNLDMATNATELRAVGMQLLDYCNHKSYAMRHRLEGRISPAEDLERICDRMYNELPEWAKW